MARPLFAGAQGGVENKNPIGCHDSSRREAGDIVEVIIMTFTLDIIILAWDIKWVNTSGGWSNEGGDYEAHFVGYSKVEGKRSTVFRLCS